MWQLIPLLCMPDSGPHIDISDEQWHMVTVSTRPDRKDGFSLYLDGELVGEVVEGEVYTGREMAY